jgi:hypothetical protein
MNDYVTIKTKNENHIMSKDCFIRWLCLVEIVEKTEEKAKELKINLDKFDWVKPVDFKKYIKERFKSMEMDLQAEEADSLKMFNNNHRIQECHSQTYQTQTF